MAEINSRVKNELIIRQKQLLNYNKETFGRFMQDLTREHEEWIMANKQLRHEINKMKAQVKVAEKFLASTAFLHQEIFLGVTLRRGS